MNLPDWGWYLTAAMLGAFGLYGLPQAFFFDREYRRRRCPKCFYVMEGVPGLQCPECGAVAPFEHLTKFRRRRWVLGVLAGIALVVLAPISAVQPRVQSKGWVSIVPTTVLLMMRPSFETGGPVFHELQGRLGHMWGWQYEIAFARCDVAGLRFLHQDKNWPSGIPINVLPPRTGPWGGVGSDWVTCEPQVELLPTGHDNTSAFADGVHYEVLAQAMVPDGPFTLRYHLIVRRDLNGAPGDVVWEGDTDIPITVGGPIDPHWKPMLDPAMDDAVEKGLRAKLVTLPASGRLAVLVGPCISGVFGPAVVCPRYEFLREGKVVATAQGSYIQTAGVAAPATVPVVVDGDAGELAAASPDDPAWTVRVVGDGATVMRFGGISRLPRSFWAGEVVMPLLRFLGPGATATPVATPPE